MSIREDENFTYYTGYRVPKNYTIPPGRPRRESPRPSATSKNVTEQAIVREYTSQEWQLVALGVAALFGGLALGEVHGRRKKVE